MLSEISTGGIMHLTLWKRSKLKLNKIKWLKKKNGKKWKIKSNPRRKEGQVNTIQIGSVTDCSRHFEIQKILLGNLSIDMFDKVSNSKSSSCPRVGPTCPPNSRVLNSRTKRKGSTPVLNGEILRKSSTVGLTPSQSNNLRPNIQRRLSENPRLINRKDSIVSKGMLRNMLGSSTTQTFTFLNKILKVLNYLKKT